MSKIRYTIDVDEYVCTALDQVRKMHDTRDYSSLLAVVERIQHHANNMESAIRDSFEGKYAIRRMLRSETLTAEEFRNKVKDLPIFKKKDDDIVYEDYE